MIVLNAISDWLYAVAAFHFIWFGVLLVLFAAIFVLNTAAKVSQTVRRWLS